MPDLPLIAGRECGECSACCQYFPIADPALTKPANVLCGNYVKGRGCCIYEARPKACRSYHCGWRYLTWVPDDWRPEKSGVMITVDPDGPVFTFLIVGDKMVVFHDGFLRVIAAVLSAGQKASLAIPGPAGHFPAHVPLNEPLAQAVANRDLAAARSLMMRIMGTMLQHKWEPDPVGAGE